MSGSERDDVAVVSVALAWSTAAALLVAGVVAVRVSGTVAVPLGWLSAWGPIAAIVGICAASIRLVGPSSRSVLVLLSTAVVILGPLALFGELLKGVTHHRPLGAATFAVFAVLAIVLTAAFVNRLYGWSSVSEPRRALARATLAAVLGLGCLVGGGMVLRALGDDSAGAVRGASLDLALMAVAVTVAVWGPAWNFARRPIVAIGVWGAVVAMSAVALIAVPTARSALSQATPAFLPLAGWLDG